MLLSRLHQIAVFARDLNESIAFYRDILDAQFIRNFDPPGLAFFDFSGTRILLETNGPKSTLYFWVDDIDATHQELTSRGIAFTHPPQCIHRDDNGDFGNHAEESWTTFFSDTSGNTLALASRKLKQNQEIGGSPQ